MRGQLIVPAVSYYPRSRNPYPGIGRNFFADSGTLILPVSAVYGLASLCFYVDISSFSGRWSL
jgi:hypothetical protein